MMGAGSGTGVVDAGCVAGAAAVVGDRTGGGALRHRWAGGCTSGHGLSGCPAGSPDSLATTATFFGTAIVVTFALHLLTGGAL
jgi:hypothetical protein